MRSCLSKLRSPWHDYQTSDSGTNFSHIADLTRSNYLGYWGRNGFREVARLCPTGQIFAIEKTSAGQVLIEQNKERFQVKNLTVVAGTAPASLEQLPQPDRIFIGGSGGQLIPILDHCQFPLKSRGVIVMAIASLEHLSLAMGWFRAKNWACSIQHLQISQSVNFAELTRFSSLNPVYLLSANLSD